jgi:hypothetical protein
MPLVIDAVDTKADLKQFIGLPARLYEDFASYVAPLTLDRNGLLDPDRSPFFTHGTARYWIARRDGEAVGRISAQIDRSQPTAAFGDAGMFGCLDAVNDVAVVRALIETAESWLREQGKHRALGPCLLSMNEEPGLLVAGCDEPPQIMAPWHPPYLAPLLESCGYAACRDLHYWRLDNLRQKLGTLSRRRRLLDPRGGHTVRSLDMRNLAGDLEIIRHVYNDAWQDNWGFVPLAKEDLESISRDMKPFVKPEFGMIVEQAGSPIGAAMILPNLFEITADLGADPTPIGWLKLGYRTLFHKFRTGRVIILGVASKLRYSVGGAMIAMTMIDEIIRRFSDYDADWIEAGWVLDDNRPLQKILQQFGFRTTRTLRLYDKELRSI